ncbi:RNA polymerase sigma factor [Ilumatobacter fluminis]|uniref:RNA polymerase sigma factor n=1 Tax=Ilumatobacter fluminis TaxID=467091 RepID=UPI0032EF9962
MTETSSVTRPLDSGIAVADWPRSPVLWLMGVSQEGLPSGEEFTSFVRRVQPRLQRGLVATYGPDVGRQATVDALSWAWEHWDQIRSVENQTGYLYRVGQSASRRYVPKPLPPELLGELEQRFPDVEPRLVPALARLSTQQRTVVVLVHGFGWSQADVAGLLELNPSTVREHLSRALSRLRDQLEVANAHEYR